LDSGFFAIGNRGIGVWGFENLIFVAT